MRKREAIFILIVLVLAVMPPAGRIPHAAADGAASTEKVWVEWYESTWTGQGSATSGEYGIEDYMGATYIPAAFNVTALNVDYINVTAMRAYIEWQDTNEAFDRDWVFSVYEYVSATAADALIHSETFNKDNLDGDPLVRAWNSRTLVTPWNLSVGDYFFGVGTEGGAGSVRLEGTNSGPAGSGYIVDSVVGGIPPAPDPFVEWASQAGWQASIQIRYWGYNETVTLSNTYVGNATHFTASRLIKYNFPVGAANEQLQFTFPVDENLINITKSGGGILTASQYSNALYNATHRIITIPEATIDLYGGEYTLHTASFSALYTFNGLYYENGTFAQNISITLYLSNGTTIDLWVNGSTTYGSDVTIDEISWEAGQDARPIAMIAGAVTGTFWLFTPEDTYGIYQFDINDYSGRLGSTENYLETYRAVNGSWQLIERRQFTGIYNPVPALMVVYKIYKIQIVFTDADVYDYGYFYPGVDLAPTLAITTIPFSDQARTVYTLITAEATRPNATRILLAYEDATPGYDTTEANMTITYRNGSLAYSSVVAGADSITFNWYGANNVTDYVVQLDIIHQLHGSLKQSWILDYGRTFGAWPDFSLFGDMGGLPVNNILGIFVGLIIAGGCSYKSRALAPFLFMSTIALFTYMGGASFSILHLEIGFSLAILLGLALGGDA